LLLSSATFWGEGDLSSLNKSTKTSFTAGETASKGGISAGCFDYYGFIACGVIRQITAFAYVKRILALVCWGSLAVGSFTLFLVLLICIIKL
jgi:hypothetical protein